MNVFRSLREYLKFLAGGDEAEPAPEKKQVEPRPVVRPVQRAQRSQGDGFDAGSGQRVDLRGGANVPVVEPQQPESSAAPILPNYFNASLDDLALIDEPMEEQGEFIPEGGMSTQSLMQEFQTLDPEAVAASIAAASAAPSPTLAPEPSVSVAESIEGEAAAAPSPRGGEGRGEGLPGLPPEPSVSVAEAAAPVSELEPTEVQGELVPEGGMSTQALMQEFQTLDPAVVADSIASALPEAAALPTVTEAAGHPLTPTLSPSGERETDGHPLTPTLSPSGERETEAIDSAEFATPDSTFAFAAPSLAESSFESAPVDSEAVEPAPAASPEPSSFEESSFTPADPSRAPVVKQAERMVPAWLVPATKPAAPKAAPSGTDFNASLDDLGLLVEQPAPEPAASEPSPQPSPPPPGEGEK